MNWPWVSRARLEDARQDLAEARQEIAALQLEVKQLHNQMVFRATGVPLYPDMEVLPERLIPKAQPTPTILTQKDDDAPMTPVQEAMKATGSRNPRVIAQEITRRNLAAFASVIHAVPPPVASREGILATPADKTEFAAAAEDLTKAAG